MTIGKTTNKAARVAERKRLYNRSIKRKVKRAITVVEDRVAAGDSAALEESKKVVSAVDRAGSKGVFHRNKIARIKSRIQKKVNALEINEVEEA